VLLTSLLSPKGNVSKSAPTETAGVASPALNKRIEESIAKLFLLLWQSFSIGCGVSDSSRSRTEDETPGPSNRCERFYVTEEDVELSSELLDLTTKAFTKSLSKDKWKELSASYPPIKGTDGFMGTPTMEAGMKEKIRKSHGFRKTKDVFVFDDGLAEQ